MIKGLLADRVLLTVLAVGLIGVSSIVVLGLDAATSSAGTGTVTSLTIVGRTGNFSHFAGTISTGSGPFAFALTCLHLNIGDRVQYEHDFLDGYVMVGTLPDNCTAT